MPFFTKSGRISSLPPSQASQKQFAPDLFNLCGSVVGLSRINLVISRELLFQATPKGKSPFSLISKSMLIEHGPPRSQNSDLLRVSME